LAVNPRDEIAFKRIAQLLPGIGGKGAEKLWLKFAAACQPVEATSSAEKPAPVSATPLALALQGCAASAPKKATVAWAQLVATVAQLETAPARGNASRMIQLVIEAGYEDYLEENHDNFANRLDDLQQLAIFAQQFSSAEDFLSQLALLTNLEAEAEQASNQDDERIRLSTIHQAKGLEFDVVFLIMLCEGLFPSSRSMGSTEGEEEERRLFYVAITRARNEVYFTYPLVRMMPGSGDAMQQPSRFLSEIPNDLIEEWNLKPAHPYG
jgi:DNA helicase II / ATP-dependent DNA helicase PcrA